MEVHATSIHERPLIILRSDYTEQREHNSGIPHTHNVHVIGMHGELCG